MPKLKKSAPKKLKRKVMKKEMDKFVEGKLHSGSKKGPIVKSRAQAIAIGLSESGQSNKKKEDGSLKKKKVVSHVKKDIETFKHEAKEDRALLKSLKSKKSKK